jgi:lipopolysaccharide transport system ATP-binding protein
LAVGDIDFQEKCLGKMRAVSGEGRTVIFVSHNMAAIRTLCRAGLLLGEGQVLFQGSASEAITTYLAHASVSRGSVWLRPDSLALPEIGFEKISISVVGVQPRLKLVCEINMRCRTPAAPSFIAVDIRDQTFSVIMQALPNPRPFVHGQYGIISIDLEITLPPLIPGVYTTDFWIGHHYTETIDYIPYALSFPVLESPTVGRAFPHTIDHGSIVPLTEVLACRYEGELTPDIIDVKSEAAACR